jgi:hypothetical protein
LDLRWVAQVFRRTSHHLRVVRYRDGRGNVETIRTTDEHPFWVEGIGWLRADVRRGSGGGRFALSQGGGRVRAGRHERVPPLAGTGLPATSGR